MNDRLHKSIYGQTLDEMKEDKGAWEYKKITNKDIIRKTIEDYVCNKETDTAKAQGMLNALRIMDEVLEQDYICDTCKHNDKEWDEDPCDGCCGNHSGYEPSSDLISRQLVDEIKELMTDISGDTVYAVRMSYLRQLPSVKQEPKTGHWIDQYNDGDWHCSKCGAIVEKDEQINHNWYFCYHCGCRMIPPQEERDKEC